MATLRARPPPLSWSHKSAYAVGHGLNDLTAGCWFSLVLLVFTSIDQLTKHEAGLLMLIGQVADALATPVVGYLSDRTRTRWGARRPWHLAGCVAVAVSFPSLMSSAGFVSRLAAHGPHWARSETAVHTMVMLYYATVVVVFQLGWAASQVSHMAICPELSPDWSERTELNSMRYAATVACNLFVYAVTWAMLLGHHGPLRPDDQMMFTRLGIGLVVLGMALSVWFHVGMNDVARAASSATRTGAARVAPLPRGALDFDSWDSMEAGGGHIPSPRASPLPPDVDGEDAHNRTGAEAATWASFDSFEGLMCGMAAPAWMPPAPPPPMLPALATVAETPSAASGASTWDAATAAEGATAEEHTSLRYWLRMPELYAVAAQYMCTRLLLNASQVYLPLYLVNTLRLPTSAIAKAPLVLYLASLGATGVLREANERFGRQAVMLASLLLCALCSLIWQQLAAGQDLPAFATAALLGWSSSCAMVTTLSLAADVIGDRCANGAVIYGLLSLTDKLSSGIAIMWVQANDPCAVAPGGDDGVGSDECAELAAAYYRNVMSYLPGAAAAAALGVLAVSAALRPREPPAPRAASSGAPSSDGRGGSRRGGSTRHARGARRAGSRQRATEHAPYGSSDSDLSSSLGRTGPGAFAAAEQRDPAGTFSDLSEPLLHDNDAPSSEDEENRGARVSPASFIDAGADM